LRGIFSLYDTDNSGYITPNELHVLLKQIGRNNLKTPKIIDHGVSSTPVKSQNSSKPVGEERNGRISFRQFLNILQSQYPPPIPSPSPNERTIQFLQILEEYRLASESEGNYLEANRIQAQLNMLRNYEESRQQNAIRAQQIKEKIYLEKIHQNQYTQFEVSWNEYMKDFEEKGKKYLLEMIELQNEQVNEFQNKLKEKMLSKPPKWSRELLEWRKRQHVLAKQKNYAEAQKIKAISDALESEERSNMNSNYSGSLAKKEANLRALQMAERSALEKRIRVRRRELIKRKESDCQRLKQRNRNLMVSLDSKQKNACTKLFSEIKLNITKELRTAQLEREERLKIKSKSKTKRSNKT